MPAQKTRVPDDWTDSASGSADNHLITDETLVIRNYDDSAHGIQVTVTNHRGETVFDRAVSLNSRETVSIQTRLDRAVYRIDARLDTGGTARADCLLGSDPDECAMIETGNGMINVAEDHFC